MDRMTQAERREQGRAANEGLALQLQYNKLLDEDVQVPFQKKASKSHALLKHLC